MGWFYCTKYQKVTNTELELECSMHHGHHDKSCMNNPSITPPLITIMDEAGYKYPDCCRYLAIRTDDQCDDESWSLWTGGRPY